MSFCAAVYALYCLWLWSECVLRRCSRIAYIGWSKRKPAKFGEGSSSRADWLCFGCPKLVRRRKATNSNKEHFFCASQYIHHVYHVASLSLSFKLHVAVLNPVHAYAISFHIRKGPASYASIRFFINLGQNMHFFKSSQVAYLQGSAKRRFPVLVNFISALAYHFCLA